MKLHDLLSPGLPKESFFPMPIWKASPLQKEEGLYGSIFQALPALDGEGLKPLLGDSGMLCLLKCSSWVNFPSPAALKSPGSQTSLHISRGENQHGCFTT